MDSTAGKNRCFAAASLLVILIAFLLAGALAGGDIMTGDSPGYIGASLCRDGLYPGFLALLRGLFGGNEAYLSVAAYLQDIFLALSLWTLCLYLKRAFRLSGWMAWLSVLMGVAGILVLSVVSMKRMLMSHCIMTEGLAMPIVLLSARLLLQGVLEKRYGPLWLSLCCIFPALMLRGQMWFLLVLWLLCMIYASAVQRARLGRYALLLGLCALLGAVGVLGGKLLHLGLSGRFESTQFGKTTVAAKLLYLADGSDAALFDGDAEAQDFFTAVYAQAMRDEDNYGFAGEGFLGRIRHYSGCYNDLLYLNIKPVLNAAYGEDTDNDAVIAKNELCGRLIKPLLKSHPERYIALTFDSLLLGLIRSNSALLLNNEQLPAILESTLLRTALLAWSALMYALLIVMAALTFHRDCESRAGRMTVFCAVLTLGNIAPNALAYNVISRYAILGALPLYFSFLMLIWELTQKKPELSAGETSGPTAPDR